MIFVRHDLQIGFSDIKLLVFDYLPDFRVLQMPDAQTTLIKTEKLYFKCRIFYLANSRVNSKAVNSTRDKISQQSRQDMFNL